MNLELVELHTNDGLFLPGLLYEAAEKKRAMIYLHGNGSASSFYNVSRMNTLGAALTDVGWSFFPFNNRGAHYIKKLRTEKDGVEGDIREGTAYELIAECVHDIDAAVDFLRARGYEQLVLVGHSTGANKVCVYNAHRPDNELLAYGLLGAGDDTGIFFAMMGKERFYSALQICTGMISAGKGRELVPSDWVSGQLYSYQSLFDTINPDGEYNCFPFLEHQNGWQLSAGQPHFALFRKLTKPLLILYGEADQYCGDINPQDALEILRSQAAHPEQNQYGIIPEAEHSFHGKERELSQKLIEWIGSLELSYGTG